MDIADGFTGMAEAFVLKKKYALFNGAAPMPFLMALQGDALFNGAAPKGM
jgi:hypothetical protein